MISRTLNGPACSFGGWSRTVGFNVVKNLAIHSSSFRKTILANVYKYQNLIEELIPASFCYIQLSYLYIFNFFLIIYLLQVLAPFSLISNVFLGLGIAITFHYLLQDIPSSYDRPEFKSWKQLPLFVGTSIYAFEGIGVVRPYNLIACDLFNNFFASCVMTFHCFY